MNPTDPDPLRTASLRPGDSPTTDPDATHTHAPGRTPRPADAPPTVPGYAVEGVLGRGGMGVVYKARHLALKRTVALKMIRGRDHASASELKRFRTEAEAVARLQHPNIVQIHDVGEADGRPYCALEFVDGDTLAARLADKPLAPRRAAELVETLARAMQVAHSKGVVHRDLKPSNVLVAADGTPKITDFGLARKLDTDSGDTLAGALLGTPSYMAPEQADGRGHEAGPPADVYALGAILYECLTGKPPFRGDSAASTLIMVQTTDPVPLARLSPKVPRDLETVCQKAMAKQPDRRYASAGDLAHDLRRFLANEPILARRAGVAEKLWRRARRNPAVAGLGAAVVALGVVVGVIASRPTTPPPPPPTPPAVDTSADDLLAIVADLDRTDPNWRFEKLQAARPGVPDERNGGLHVLAFRKRVAEFVGRPGSEAQWLAEEVNQRLQARQFDPPTERLGADLAAFRAELERVAVLVPVARKMIDFPAGRFLLVTTRDFVGTTLADHQAARHMADLLDIDARVQLDLGNPAQAVANCWALFHCASAFDGEPMGMSQAIRNAILLKGVRLLERLAVRDALHADDLPRFAGRLGDELRYPMHETMARGERAVTHYFLGSLAAGDVTPEALGAFNLKERAEVPPAAELRRLHATQLKSDTRWVEVARRPAEEWPEQLGQLDAGFALPAGGRAIIELLSRGQFTEIALKHAANVRAAATALAVERFRRAKGAWPATLADLVPAYLTEVPRDPFDGAPLRFARLPDGVVVYSVGPDRADNRGNLDRGYTPPPGTDIGFRLWDADKRSR